MAYEHGQTGTLRTDRQAYLTGTQSAIRIYDVVVLASLSNVAIYFTDNAPTTTATSTTNEKLRVVCNTSSTTYWIGTYSSTAGVLFTNGALLHTCTAFGYATINYNSEQK